MRAVESNLGPSPIEMWEEEETKLDVEKADRQNTPVAPVLPERDPGKEGSEEAG